MTIPIAFLLPAAAMAASMPLLGGSTQFACQVSRPNSTWQRIELPNHPTGSSIQDCTALLSRNQTPNNKITRYELSPMARREGRPYWNVTTTGSYTASRVEKVGRLPAYKDLSNPKTWPDPEGSTREYDWQVLVPKGFPLSQSARDWTILTQWKGWLGGSPPLTIEIKRSNLRLGGTRTNTGRVPHDGDLGSLTPGAWTHLRVAIHWSRTDKGWIEVYRDGRLAIPRIAIPTMDAVRGAADPVYLKQGIYRAHSWQVDQTVFQTEPVITVVS